MDHTDLPNEVRDFLGESGAPMSAKLRLDTLAVIIGGKRDEAVSARKMSGIEETWMECEEAYLGIDDENRNEFMGSRWAKPTTMSGPVTTGERRPNSSSKVRSTAYVRLTSRYVDAGTAKLCEITLPIDDKAFSISPSPVPELIAAKDDKTPVVDPQTGQKLMRDPKPHELKAMASAVSGTLPQQPGVQPAAAQPVPLTHGDLAEEQMDQAADAAKKAEKRIYDWMVESRYPGEMRKVIHDAARIGTGVLKGPFPTIRYDRATTKDAQGNITLQLKERIVPSYKWVDVWNIYPDGACGEDIQNGSHIFEVDYLSPRSVEALKDNPAYLPGRIEQVLKMGPAGKTIHLDRPEINKQKKDDGRYEVWYMYGVLERADIDACIEEGAQNISAKESMFAIVTLINDIVVRVTTNPLESGEFCYHAIPWSRRVGHWAGVGVGEQVRMPQRMVTAATRAMLVNASKSAGSQIVLDMSCVTPADLNWEIYPDKVWLKAADATVDDVRKAFATFTFPNVQKEMMGIIEYGFKLAEETSSIPLITQGQSGKTTPDTLGGQQLQDNNANQLLRAIGHMLDDTITEPVVTQSYEWLLLDPEIPNDEKGDFQIDAHGSSAMVERYIQNQAITNMANMSINPVYGLDPKKYAKELLRSQKLDPRNFTYTAEEQAKLDSQPPPVDPIIQAAQLRNASAEKIAAGNQGVTMEKAKLDTDRDTAYNQSLSDRDQIMASARREELLLKRELAMMEYANREKLTLEQVKAGLAKTAMVENTRKELASAELAMAERQAMFDRTHDKLKHNDKIGIDTTPSLVRDEVSTNVTP